MILATRLVFLSSLVVLTFSHTTHDGFVADTAVSEKDEDTTRTREAIALRGAGGSTSSKKANISVPDSSNHRSLDPDNQKCTDFKLDGDKDWHDSYNGSDKYTCYWYAQKKEQRCKDYGEKHENYGKTANEACCACGGGESTKAARTNDESCTDKTMRTGEEWHDSEGEKFNCDWYENHDYCKGRDCCEVYGNRFRNGDHTASTACCACGGGTDTKITAPPTMKPTPEPIKQSRNPQYCKDLLTVMGQEWHDSGGSKYNCDYYGAKADSRCSKYGHKYKDNGMTANEACCDCGGGSGKTSSSPVNPTPPKKGGDDDYDDDDTFGVGPLWEEWLTAHNKRRKYYHEKYGRSYVPVKWSRMVEAKAQAYANKLIGMNGCVMEHDKDKDEGENLYKSTSFRSPDRVLTGWTEEEELSVYKPWTADEKIENYKSGHGHYTQVLWRATHYIGCATASKDRCHLQVCRYLRKGNCNREYNDWFRPMMADTSRCGPFCPSGGEECCGSNGCK